MWSFEEVVLLHLYTEDVLHIIAIHQLPNTRMKLLHTF